MTPFEFAVISFVISTAVSLKQASDEKKQAKKTEEIQKRRLALEDQRRATQLAVEKDRLGRVTRAERAIAANAAANRGAINTSSFALGDTAIGTGGNRELNILANFDAINVGINQVGGEQIAQNASAAITNANTGAFSSILDAGVGAFGSLDFSSPVDSTSPVIGTPGSPSVPGGAPT